VNLVAPAAVLGSRLHERRGHYMPPELLASQFATLEPLGADEPDAVVQTEGGLDVVVDAILSLIGPQGD
jgi:gluconokinase